MMESSIVESISENPFASRFMRGRGAEPLTLVIFGASGDLTRRKLIPALFNLYKDGHLDAPINIIGFARRKKSDSEFQKEMTDAINSFSRRKPDSDEQLSSFIASVGYVSGTFEESIRFSRTLPQRPNRASCKDRLPCLKERIP